MKKFLVVIFMAAAWAGGYGYGRWYAKPAGRRAEAAVLGGSDASLVQERTSRASRPIAT